MKKIGLLCGLSWLSTKIYYEKINSIIANRAGGLNSAKLVMNNVNNNDFVTLVENQEFHEVEKKLLTEIQILERAGASCVGLTCNTLHYFLDNIAHKINIPIIHILKIINQHLSNTDIKTVGVIATKYSIKLELHRNYLKQVGINTLYPSEIECNYINDAIFEVCSGRIDNSLKQHTIQIANSLIDNGAEVIILGCTELGLLVNQSDFDVPVIDTALLHAISLAEYSLEDSTLLVSA